MLQRIRASLAKLPRAAHFVLFAIMLASFFMAQFVVDSLTDKGVFNIIGGLTCVAMSQAIVGRNQGES